MDVAAVVIVLAAMVGLLVVPPPFGFVGWDTYPILAASRIASWGDLRGIFTDSLTADYFPFGFYRPVCSLSMALDYALWGLDPIGFRVTNAVVFGAAALALYRFTRLLLGPDARLGPLVALLTTLVFPFHSQLAAGPFANRSDLLCGLFVLLALGAELRRIDSTARWRHVVPACLTLLAQASKEAGIVLPPLVFVLVLLEARPARTGRLRRALVAAAWHGCAVGLVVAARTLVLHGMAGHASTSVTALSGRFLPVLGRVVVALVAQRPALAPITALDVAAALVFLLGLAGLVAACVRAVGRDDSTSRTLRAASFGGVVMLVAAAVFALVGWVAPWYLFLPSLGLAIVCGAAAEAARASATSREAWWPASGTVLPLLAVWMVWQASASPFVRRDTIWAEWTRTNDTFLAGLEALVRESPTGTVISVPYPGRVLQPYSVQAWADLVLGAGRVRVVTGRHAGPSPASQTTVVLVGEARWRE